MEHLLAHFSTNFMLKVNLMKMKKEPNRVIVLISGQDKTCTKAAFQGQARKCTKTWPLCTNDVVI